MRLNFSRRGWWGGLLSLGVAAVAGASTLAPAAAAAVVGFSAGGYVRCANDWPVVGVWVNAGGSSGWASLSGANWAGWRSYSKYLGARPTYSLTVGCGGTPQRWATSNTARGGLLGMAAGASYYVTCNNRGTCGVAGVF